VKHRRGSGRRKREEKENLKIKNIKKVSEEE
jgi:hypothetical protein